MTQSNNITNESEEETPQTNNYIKIVDGDLHKLINKKSDYLADMLDLKES